MLCFLHITRRRKNSGTVLPLHADVQVLASVGEIQTSLPSNDVSVFLCKTVEVSICSRKKHSHYLLHDFYGIMLHMLSGRSLMSNDGIVCPGAMPMECQ
jgi:hypothetical protein